MITREINFYLTPTFNKYPLFITSFISYNIRYKMFETNLTRPRVHTLTVNYTGTF